MPKYIVPTIQTTTQIVEIEVIAGSAGAAIEKVEKLSFDAGTIMRRYDLSHSPLMWASGEPKLQPTQKQIDDKRLRYNTAMGEMQYAVDKAIHGDSYVNYSAYKSDAEDIPINNLNEVAVKGKMQIVQGSYTSAVLKSPTWLQLTVHANACMLANNDMHHRFFEGVYETCKKGEDGVAVYGLVMGS